MLSPKKIKWRRQFRGKTRGNANSGNFLSFGNYGLQAIEAAWVSSRQIEASRVAISRGIKKGGKIWIRIFPDRPYTKKPTEVRMGKGKGPTEYYVAVVKPGRILFEMEGVDKEIANKALSLAADKLPMKTRVVVREDNQA